MKDRVWGMGWCALVLVTALTPAAALADLPADVGAAAVAAVERAGYTDANAKYVGPIVVVAALRGKSLHLVAVKPGTEKLLPLTTVAPGGTWTVTGAPFARLDDLLEVRATNSFSRAGGGSSVETLHFLIRLSKGDLELACQFRGTSSSRPGPPECGFHGDSRASIRVPRTTPDVVFEVTLDRDGWGTAFEGGSCVTRGMPSHPPPDVMTYTVGDKGACSKTMARSELPGGTTLGSHAELGDPGSKLPLAAVKEAFSRARESGHWAKCAKLEKGTVTVKFRVATDGSVSWARPRAPHDKSPVGKCVAKAMRKLKFPANDGKTPHITYPISLR